MEKVYVTIAHGKCNTLEEALKLWPKTEKQNWLRGIKEGVKIGKLTALYISNIPTTKFYPYIVCRCDCGIYCYMNEYTLLHPNIQVYYGCKECADKNLTIIQHTQENNIQNINNVNNIIIGNKYYDLIVLEKAKDNKWLVKCECGNIFEISENKILDGKSHCPHNFGSGRSNIIGALLQQSKINFTREKTFSDLCNPATERKLRFDYYVDDRYIIEYDESQHFDTNSKTFTTDMIKNNYCFEHHIPIIRIKDEWYDGLKMSDVLLSSSVFIIHNKAELWDYYFPLSQYIDKYKNLKAWQPDEV